MRKTKKIVNEEIEKRGFTEKQITVVLKNGGEITGIFHYKEHLRVSDYIEQVNTIKLTYAVIKDERPLCLFIQINKDDISYYIYN